MVLPCYDAKALAILRADAEQRRKSQLGQIVVGVVQVKYLEEGRVPVVDLSEPGREVEINRNLRKCAAHFNESKMYRLARGIAKFIGFY